MRVLKTILIILGALAVLVGILLATAPKTYRYERSVTIEAPPVKVYPFISTFAAMDKWSPWNELDPTMKKSIEGTDGTVGAKSKWEGNDKVGTGEQTLTAVTPEKSVAMDLKFIAPWESESDVLVELVPEGDGTKATWSMSGNNDMASRFMGVFMDMEEMIGKDFDKGLTMLKQQAEEAATAEKAALAEKTFDGYVIELIDRPQIVYVGKRNKRLKWADMEAFYGTNFGAVAAALGAAKIEMAGPPSGVLWAWNEQDQSADLMAAMPVQAGPEVKVAGFETHVVPAGKMAMTPYYGDYAKNMPAHVAMDAYIKAKGLTHYGNVIEEYVTDPGMEPDTAKWLTNIYYMVK